VYSAEIPVFSGFILSYFDISLSLTFNYSRYISVVTKVITIQTLNGTQLKTVLLAVCALFTASRKCKMGSTVNLSICIIT
jgi:hypothetical protein